MIIVGGQHPEPRPDARQRDRPAGQRLHQLPLRGRDRARAAGSDRRADRHPDGAPATWRRDPAATTDGLRDMNLLWQVLHRPCPLITHGDPYLLSIISFTLQVAAIATAAGTLIGVPIGLAMALGRFRGRRRCSVLSPTPASRSRRWSWGSCAVLIFVAAGSARERCTSTSRAGRSSSPRRPRAPVHRRADRGGRRRVFPAGS